MKTVIFLLVLAAAWYHFYYIETLPNSNSDTTVDAGPFQDKVKTNKFEFKDVILTEKATYSVTARVLSAERYYLDRNSNISNLDVLIGWYNLSNESILNQIEFSQSSRQYQWHAPTQVLSEQEIQTSSSNLHLIPENDDIAQQLKRLKIGQIIYLNGILVDVNNPSGWHWKTSLSRSDTGKHSSEILYVTEFEIVDAI
ncbi:hypothetical protein MNBD_GAMMA04-1708 [hydrothermal vent metagenome]|uniref:Uncharacterized protein n=1 Tax=hydrothermal vent metagenome TaxID=652676 RepID=A0A3B0WE60_9ZZZZ